MEGKAEEKKETLPVRVEALPAPIVDEKVVDDFLFSTGTRLSDEQKTLFKAMAVRNNLDPFKREIHALTFKNADTGKIELSVVTGYEVYIKRAERTGKLQGWKVWIDGEGEQMKAKIQIRKKGYQDLFEWEVEFSEYNLGRALWKTKKKTMLKKVAMAQGFRLAFQEDLAGMPYTFEEAEIIRDDASHEETKPDGPDMELVKKFDTEAKKRKVDGDLLGKFLSDVAVGSEMTVDEVKAMSMNDPNVWTAFDDWRKTQNAEASDKAADRPEGVPSDEEINAELKKRGMITEGKEAPANSSESQEKSRDGNEKTLDQYGKEISAFTAGVDLQKWFTKEKKEKKVPDKLMPKVSEMVNKRLFELVRPK
jgi:phage recombination protein Bet